MNEGDLIAENIRIVRQYPESMEQKWVEAIEKTSNQVIYLPTEASVPITESSRMAQKAKAGK